MEDKDLDLGPIEARLKAATPGPWVYRESQSWIYGCELVSMADGLGMRDAIVLAFGYSGDADMTTPGKEPSDENTDFIINAPTDITALVAEVHKLRRKINLYAEQDHLTYEPDDSLFFPPYPGD